ncbi:MAG: YsnF/AvaK domain-containing protein [Ginsengibacter sp.]
MEKEMKSSDEQTANNKETHFGEEKTKVIPVIEEVLNVDKKVVETGKLHIRKEVAKEEQQIEIAIINESYEVKKVPVKNLIFDKPPSIRDEGNVTIIPVIKEVAEIKIRYEVSEEIHVIKNKTVTPHSEKVTLKKEKVIIERDAPKK